jgi:MFS family permease
VSVAVLDRAFTRTDKFPGWWVVFACFVLMTMQAGVGFYGLAVFLNAFSNELGWTVSSISLATTVFFFVGAISGLWIAKLIAKHDVRIVVLAGAVGSAVCLLLLGYVTARWQLYLVYAVYAVGWVAVGQGPATTVVTRWFHVKRTSALALASTGMSVGGIAVTPVVKSIVDNMGMRSATPWLALMWLATVVPVTLLFIRPDPHRYGWMPDGERSESNSPVNAIGLSLAEAMKTRFFFALAIGYFFAFFAQVGSVQQMVKMVEERTTPGTATLALMVLSVMSIIGRFGAQGIVMRLDKMRFTVSLTIVQGIAFLTMAFSNNRTGLLIGAALFGLTIGNLLMMQSLLVADRFGVKDFPQISARIAMVATMGMAAGPFALGWLRDNAGGYTTSYVVAALCSVVALGVFMAAVTDSRAFDD